MKIKFQVLGSGQTSFHSSKTNRDYQRVRLMGFAEDCEGTQIPATADMGFDCSVSEMPKSGQTCILDISEVSSRNAMLEMTFQSIQILKAK